MKDNKIDNTISIFEEVFEKYKDDENIKELQEKLMILKEKRNNRK